MKKREFKGTKGKWHANEVDVCDDKYGQYVADCGQSTFISEDEKKANAQLIAAAPELLEALQESNELIEWLFDNGGYTGMETAYNRTINQMNDNEEAINKALES